MQVGLHLAFEQWGLPIINGAAKFSWPIAFTSHVAGLSAFAQDKTNITLEHISFYECNNNSVMLYAEDSTLKPAELVVSVIAIGA